MINVPLKSLLFGGAIDSRSKAGRGVDIDQLANSIEKLGLILPLSVIAEDDKWRVVDGNRRLEALKKIHKGKKDVEVPVLVQSADTATARAMSLAANVERLPLHHVDQYEAFAAIARDGKPLAEIAAAFGISERAVQQRMALGSLHPQVRDLYREDKLDHRTAQLLTRVLPDVQLKLMLSGEPIWKITQQLLSELDGTALSPTSALATFVTRRDYELLGGWFVSDLFVREGEEKWGDVELANGIAQDKINTLRIKALADGWGWFEQTDEWIGNNYVVNDPPLTEAQEAERDSLTERIKEIDRACEEADEQDYSPEQAAEVDTIEARLNEIEGAGSWPDDARGSLGVVVDSHFEIHYGCTRREGSQPAAETADVADNQLTEKPLSSALTMDLDCHLTRACHGALVDSPGTALRLLCLTFLSDYYLFEKLPNLYAGVGIRADFAGKALPAYDYGLEAVQAIVKECGLLKAKNFEAKMKAMFKIADEDLWVIMAFVIGRSLQTRHRNHDLPLYLDKLGLLDIRAHFTPDVDNFFGRLTKEQLRMTLADMGKGSVDLDGLKKAEAAKQVASLMPDSWVPDAIRPQKSQ